ncbi:MAG: response regulator [Planctomycetes bacterium]|nr:response regulator [Planctomycetota bacterium]
MNRTTILCIEDEPEVRDALVRDLTPFATVCRIEAAEDADDARQVVQECGAAGDRLGLILCDHLLPGTLGADLLVEFKHRPATAAARKVLVTGQAGLEDTVKAVNNADLDHYIAKPWTRDGLLEVVRQYLTDYVIDEVEDVLPYVSVLDGPRLMEALKHRGQNE